VGNEHGLGRGPSTAATPAVSAASMGVESRTSQSWLTPTVAPTTVWVTIPAGDERWERLADKPGDPLLLANPRFGAFVPLSPIF